MSENPDDYRIVDLEGDAPRMAMNKPLPLDVSVYRCGTCHKLHVELKLDPLNVEDVPGAIDALKLASVEDLILAHVSASVVRFGGL